MLAAERKKEILKIIEENGSVRTIELALKFDVTDETIRRDLDLLDKEDLVIRTHGGAVTVSGHYRELPHSKRKVVNLPEKRMIAQEAVKLINPMDWVYMDASSTVLQMTDFLRNIPLTIITNSCYVASALQNKDEIRTIILGGDFDSRSNSCTGPGTISSFKRYNFQKLFCSGNGIHPRYGLSEVNDAQAHLKELAIEKAEAAYFLADHTKIYQKSSFIFAPCNSLEALITDEAALNHPDLDQLSSFCMVKVATPQNSAE